MEKLNIAEILKDCPKGMELDCTMYESVQLDAVMDGNAYPIKIQTPEGIISLAKNGCYSLNPHCKCIIFPKGKTTWEGFQRPFKDGDILVGKSNQPFIFKKLNNSNGCFSYCGIDRRGSFLLASDDWTFANSLRFATEEERQKLFDAIKATGYKWNPETKTLEDLIVPKFKVGDRIKHRLTGDVYKVLFVLSNGYGGGVYDVAVTNEIGKSIDIEEQDSYELLPNKFDITTLKAFESRVLVRDNGYSLWQPSVWGLYDKEHRFPYITIGNRYKLCIPYKGNEHLLGTTNDCDNFYKTWE